MDESPSTHIPASDYSLAARQDWLATANIADLLWRYGLDARARSALLAGFRYGESATYSSRLDAISARLHDTDPHSSADTAALRDFLKVFVGLPEADFSPDWLLVLVDSWRRLRKAGCASDLPLRAAHALVEHGTRHLLNGRAHISALEVEILASLSSAGMCIADILNTEANLGVKARITDDIPQESKDRVLVHHLAEALAQQTAQGEGPSKVTGLLVFQIHLGPGALTLDQQQRSELLGPAFERLATQLRARDIVVQTESYGGAIVLPALRASAQVQLAVNKVTQILEMPLPVRGVPVHSPFAMGVVWSPDHGSSPEELLRCADLALKTAWREGKSIVFFDERLLTTAQQEATVEKEFQAAMDGGQLELYVQPQVEIASRRCVGGELLLRWKTSQGNAVPPWQIPDIAKRLGLAQKFTRWLLFRACRILAELDKQGIDIHLSINLMASDLMDPELPSLVQQAIAIWRISPQKLIFELIESAVLEDPVAGAAAMNRLIELGASTAIDDFGIGYSSILYLRQLPLHELKIDRAFVYAMPSSPEDLEIVKALIGLAHGLGLYVVAEGIEDEATFNMLKAHGCDRAQGYWVAKPMPPTALADWLQEWNSRQASQ